MNKKIYCVGTKTKEETVMEIDIGSEINPVTPKRVNIVSIKMIK